jgi:hypothetical protein
VGGGRGQLRTGTSSLSRRDKRPLIWGFVNFSPMGGSVNFSRGGSQILTWALFWRGVEVRDRAHRARQDRCAEGVGAKFNEDSFSSLSASASGLVCLRVEGFVGQA